MPLISRSIQTAAGRVFHDWSIAAPSARLWCGPTDPQALPCWLEQFISGNFLSGDVSTLQHAREYCCTSRIQELESERLIGMTWQFPDEQRSYVRITLYPGSATTRLMLKHDGLGNEASAHLPGWHTHLLYLQALLIDQPRPMNDFWSTYDQLAEL
jgi:uncharacterized protein YndB with AHSA1/START domain